MITPGEEVFDEGITAGQGEMEISISFQSCWDGVNLDSPDHKSHVAFPQGEEDDAPCPSSHPVRIPRLDFFIRWFNTKPARWEFSKVDEPLRFHADYISGWMRPCYNPYWTVTMGTLKVRLTFVQEFCIRATIRILFGK